MLRTQLYSDPAGRFVHDIVLETCRRIPGKTALIDSSCNRSFTYAEYGDHVESLARGFVAAGERDRVRRWAEQAALDLVRRYLEGAALPTSDRVI